MTAPEQPAAPAPTQADVGARRFFADQTYHLQTLRVLTDIAAGGADLAEVLEAIALVRAGDASAWFDAFAALARRNEARARGCADRLSRGHAWLRAHTYWRTAELLLAPEDDRRTPAFVAQTAAFALGLATLGVAHRRFDVPWQGGKLRCIFYPGPDGSEARPLIVCVGGCDSTLEELYFALARAANDRGYGVLTYEGPGQGAALREHGLPFTHEWEKPNRAVLDAYLALRPRPPAIVLVGMSMGGYLAPRAAAFDPRIDGVVAHGVAFDLGEPARRVDALRADPATHDLPGVVWAADMARWTLRLDPAASLGAAFARYSLDGIAGRIRGDVLALAGEADHVFGLHQVQSFVAACTGAQSVECVVFDRASGGAEHCQPGAASLWHATFFDWMQRRFGRMGGG
jgi:alpha-beta hydrolase superfamily lysophospholipase